MKKHLFTVWALYQNIGTANRQARKTTNAPSSRRVRSTAGPCSSFTSVQMPAIQSDAINAAIRATGSP